LTSLASAVPQIWLSPKILIGPPDPDHVPFRGRGLFVTRGLELGIRSTYLPNVKSLYLHPLRSYEHVKVIKVWQMGWFWVVRVHSGSLEIEPFHTAHTNSY